MNRTPLLEHQITLYQSKNHTRKWLHNQRKNLIEKYINDLEIDKSNALEIGPGSGIYIPTLAKQFRSVSVIDIEHAYLHQAKVLSKTHKNLSVIIADIKKSALESERYDLILCSEVLEHIDDSNIAINEIYRLLKPGGSLILSTPQKYSFLELTAKLAFLPIIVNLVKLVYREPVIEMGHINLMTENEVTKQLENSGFIIVERNKCGLYLPLIAEFLGKYGLNMEKFLQKLILKYNILTGVLWTQSYVCRKPIK